MVDTMPAELMVVMVAITQHTMEAFMGIIAVHILIQLMVVMSQVPQQHIT